LVPNVGSGVQALTSTVRPFSVTIEVCASIRAPLGIAWAQSARLAAGAPRAKAGNAKTTDDKTHTDNKTVLLMGPPK
jgi:hypothetical protein